MSEEKPGFTVTTNDASETIIIDESKLAAGNGYKFTNPIKEVTANADTP